jgi:hypothetical protein
MAKINYNLPEWKNKTKLEKILTISSFALSIIVFILAMIQIITKIVLIKVFEPLLGLTLLLGALQYWKSNKPLALTILISSIYIFIVSIIIIFK